MSRATAILPRLMYAIFLFHHSRVPLRDTDCSLVCPQREKRCVCVDLYVKIHVYEFPDVQQPVQLQKPPKLGQLPELNSLLLSVLS